MQYRTIIAVLIFLASVPSVRAVEATLNLIYSQQGAYLSFYGGPFEMGTYAVPAYPSPVTSVRVVLADKTATTQAVKASQSYDVTIYFLGSGGQYMTLNGATFMKISVTPFAHIPSSPTSGELCFRFEIPVPDAPDDPNDPPDDDPPDDDPPDDDDDETACTCGACCECKCICGGYSATGPHCVGGRSFNVRGRNGLREVGRYSHGNSFAWAAGKRAESSVAEGMGSPSRSPRRRDPYKYPPQ